ncbi:L-lactate permease [Xylanibacter ruminicola]|uniref:L-lactate permease n=2 Tax=Xylanibacter ruminicola TaxID=839 RepID=D5ETE5_XYLR2|nr:MULTISPECIES: L-lactate permease [Prevotellaceae]ADE83512.1 transporter, lactate permease (LctP) family [Xylanibacter ruminicola 23]GJG34042.1 L-lactate permease [Xylanibacter ruminicola]SEH64487.1 lactate permease [Xylanibacter ruminicola]
MSALVSAIPILLLIVLMMGFKVSGYKSAIVTLIVTVVLALFAAPALGIVPEKYAQASIVGITLWSVVEGLLKACFPIILIIICAIFSYNILCETKEIETIKTQFIQMTSDKGLLVLLLTWGLGGVLEGMAGFGTAVAIPAAILIGLGFKPMFSAVICLIANTVAVGFGAVGLPATTLANQVAASGTATPEELCEVATFIILQLSLMFFITPFLILMLTDKTKVVKNICIALFVGSFSIIVQFCCAHFIGPETPAILGSVAAIAAMLIYNKLFIHDENPNDEVKVEKKNFGLVKTLKAWSVYGLIIFFILISSKIVPPVNELLGSTLVTKFELPVIGNTFKFGWLSNAGLMIFLGAVIGGLIQGMSIGALLKLLAKTTLNLQKTVVTICCLVAMAMLMNNVGMTNDIAKGLVMLTGVAFPFFAPLIGSIGTFVTGSATNANILFGKLQATAATDLGLVNQGTFFGVSGSETNWLAAANCAGSEGGKLLSPQSIAIATAACDMEGQDGDIMRKTMPFAIFWILMNGLMVFLGLHVI